MTIAAGMIALGESFRDMATGAHVLDALDRQFAAFGATHFLATGLPLPGRPIDQLIVRMNWGDRVGSQLNTDDPVLHRAIGAHRPFEWVDARLDGSNRESPLLSGLESGPATRIIAVPICSFLPYQAVVIACGAHLVIDECSLTVVDSVCVEAFRRLFALGVIRRERPGDLSLRERRVVELSASGKTAGEIAGILEISQRTVHAHLQNASEKLRARNKTHTVVEALRHGQISV